MKKVVIFGATGGIGLHALRVAIQKGLEVTAFVRDESKIPPDIRGKVQVVVGDVTNLEQVSKATSGQDGVVVVLGITDYSGGPTTVLSDGTRNIVAAMKEDKVEMISVCLSVYSFGPREEVPAHGRAMWDDQERLFQIIKQSGLKWIAVLPPWFTDDPSSKYVIKYDESPGNTISRIDLATFMVESLSQPEHYQKVIGIANTQ